ncbi:sensor protein [Halorussus limi]|uniref:Sensor protein n=1 Tax=Halorussus limi TaxID=2938695 RepID=A0A8U0HV34_9EURY|nr:DICT sensory domain-containing protein [Halorussus limi]UPV74719.1 sensor protein [Halorussus limi]
MTLREFLDGVASSGRAVTIFAPRPCESVETYFESRNVTVEYEPIPDDGSGGFVVLNVDGEFAGSASMEAVRHLVSPTDADLEPGANEALRVTLDLLAETTFVAFEKRNLLAATREFEDRAYRVGHGTLRAGFQSSAALESQHDVYAALSTESLLDVHIYGDLDWEPDLPGATIHAEDDGELGAFWFVVFDGGDEERQACALLAEEAEENPGSFHGFWTYDTELVADIDAYLERTYG